MSHKTEHQHSHRHHAEMDASADEDLASNGGPVNPPVAEQAIAFVRAHPLATLAGGVALGVLVASLFPAPRRAARAGGARAAALAVLGGEVAKAAAQSLIERASEAGREGLRRADDLSETLGQDARAFGRAADARRTQIAQNAVDLLQALLRR